MRSFPGISLLYTLTTEPPSTRRLAPVINEAASDARKTIAAATSSGVPACKCFNSVSGFYTIMWANLEMFFLKCLWLSTLVRPFKPQMDERMPTTLCPCNDLTFRSWNSKMYTPGKATSRDSIRLTSAAPTGWAQNSTPLLG